MYQPPRSLVTAVTICPKPPLTGKTPFFVFKATEFNVSHVNQLFKNYGDFTLSDFVREHGEFADKYVIIDSAEKLSDFNQPEVFQELLSTLRSGGWKILFTTRLSYLDDLKYAFIELYNAPFEPLNIPGLTQDQLGELSVANEFSLPENERLRKFLQNPFYLNEYLSRSFRPCCGPHRLLEEPFL